MRRAPSVILVLVVGLAVLAVGYYGGLFGSTGPTPSIRPSQTTDATPTSITSAPPSARPTGSIVPVPTEPLPPRPSNTPLDTSVVAAGVVVPQRSADLAMSTTGIVRNIYVDENDKVAVGQILLRLDQQSYLADVNVADASVARSEAALDRALLAIQELPDGATTGQIESAQAELRLAQADLELARSHLAEAEAALRGTELRSPIAGTVAALNVSNGEVATSGSTLITIGDMSSWLIETTDLSELEVVRIAVGDPATVNFAALPGTTLVGHVERIQVRGTSDSGEVKFAVVIRPEVHVPQLRWNMSATVRIQPSG